MVKIFESVNALEYGAGGGGRAGRAGRAEKVMQAFIEETWASKHEYNHQIRTVLHFESIVMKTEDFKDKLMA